jgi:hypothetical protein
VSRRGPWERALRADPQVTCARLAVLLDLGTYMSGDGTGARPGCARLIADTGYQRWAVERHLRWAVKAGYLTVVRRGGRAGDGTTWPSEYAAALPVDNPVSTRPRAPVEKPSMGAEARVETVSMGVQQQSQWVSAGTSMGAPAPTTGSRTDRVSSSSKNTGSSLSAAERIVAAADVVTEDERDRFIQWIKDTHDVRGLGWWRTVAANGDLTDLAADWREECKASQRDHELHGVAWCDQCDGTGWVDWAASKPCLRCKPHLDPGRHDVIEHTWGSAATQSADRLADLFRSPEPTDYAGPIAVQATRLDGEATS